MENLWLVLPVLFLAAGVQGATGFGFGLVALGLLGHIVDIKEAVLVLAFASFAVSSTILTRLRSHLVWRDIVTVAPMAVLGVPLGVVLMVHMDKDLMRGLVGVILIVTTLQNITPHLAHKRWHPLWLGLPAGLLSGILSGAFATGGPPIIAYYHSQRWGRMRYAAALQSTIICGNVMRIFELIRKDLLVNNLLTVSLLGALCAVAGAWTGVHVLRRMSDRTLRRITAALLFVLGVRYIFTAWINRG